MKDVFWLYITNLYEDVPMSVYEGLISVCCVGVALILAIFGFKSGLKHIAKLLLAEYVFLLFCSTVFCRLYNVAIGHDFHLFWSYDAILQGKGHLIAENIMNVVVFMPIGLLLGMAYCNMRWWQALLIGCGISICVEMLQFVTHRGFSEFDDVFHNSLGCLIGFWMYRLFVASSSRLILSVNLRL